MKKIQPGSKPKSGPVIDAEDKTYLDNLVAILKEKKQMTLGDLRRQYNLSPIRLSQMINTFPNVLATREVSIGRSHTTTEISLKNEENRCLDPAIEKKLFALLIDAGENGISTSRLYSHHRVNSDQARAFTDAHAGKVKLVQRKDSQKKVRTFLSLVPVKETPQIEVAPQPNTSIDPQAEIIRAFRPEPDENLKMDRHRLHALLADSKRLDEWIIPQICWERIQEIAQAWPGELEFSPAPNNRQWFVALKQDPVTEAPPEAPAPQKAPEDNWPGLPESELEKMRWNGPRPFGHRGQASTHPQSMTHRKRNPLVKLPQ